MQYLLNERAVTAYAEKFAATVCDRFFQDNEKITGHEIVALTPVKQVNFFIIKELFGKWNREAQSLESPFFDYQNEEVKKSMTALLNTLSQNISVDRRHFEPLAIRATIDSLTLMLAPEAYYDKFLRAFNTKISYKYELQPVLKYVKTHRRILEELAEAIEEQDKKVPTEWAQQYVRGLLADDSLLDKTSNDIQSFNLISPCSIENLTLSLKTSPSKKPISVSDDEEEDDRINYYENKAPLPASEKEVIKGVAEHYTADSDSHRHIFDALQEHLIEDAGKLKLDLHEEDTKFLKDLHAKTEANQANHPSHDVDAHKHVFDTLQDHLIADASNIKLDLHEEDTKFLDGFHPETHAHKHIFDTLEDHLIADAGKLHLDLHEEDAVFLEAMHSNAANRVSLFDAGEHLDTDGEITHDFSHLFAENENASPKASALGAEQHRGPNPKPETQESDRSIAPASREPEQAKQETPAAKPLFQKDADNEDEADTRATLLDSLAGKNKPGKKLKGSIPLNLKFKFQNELFGGNGLELSQAIDLVDETESLHGAMAVLKEKYIRKYNWDMHGEAASEFMDMISKAKSE